MLRIILLPAAARASPRRGQSTTGLLAGKNLRSRGETGGIARRGTQH